MFDTFQGIDRNEIIEFFKFMQEKEPSHFITAEEIIEIIQNNPTNSFNKWFDWINDSEKFKDMLKEISFKIVGEYVLMNDRVGGKRKYCFTLFNKNTCYMGRAVTENFYDKEDEENFKRERKEAKL